VSCFEANDLTVLLVLMAFSTDTFPSVLGLDKFIRPSLSPVATLLEALQPGVMIKQKGREARNPRHILKTSRLDA
jgi:hypothetical protein